MFVAVPCEVDFGAFEGECVDLIPEFARQRQEPRLLCLGRSHCADDDGDVAMLALCVVQSLVIATSRRESGRIGARMAEVVRAHFHMRAKLFASLPCRRWGLKL